VLIHDEPFPVKPMKAGAEYEWAAAISACVDEFGRDVVFIGPPAEQWRLAQAILNGASRGE
jgi:hypothetical protein